MSHINLSSFKNKKIALVLSGGGIKAMAWHLGVTKALLENGLTIRPINKENSDLEITTFVGSSSGALTNAYLLSGLHPQELIEIQTKKNTSPIPPFQYRHFFSVRKFFFSPRAKKWNHYLKTSPFPINFLLFPFSFFTGIFSLKKIEKYFSTYLLKDSSFEKFEQDFFVVASPLDSSKKVVFNNKKHVVTKLADYRKGTPLIQALCASMSVPPLFPAFMIGDEYFIDGEIRDTLSAHIAEENGCEVIIKSWTHMPLQKALVAQYGVPAILLQQIYLLIEQKISQEQYHYQEKKNLFEKLKSYVPEDDLINIFKEFNFNPKTIYLNIHPDPEDEEIFFTNAFSLNKKLLEMVFNKGYHAAQKSLEIYSMK